jgi:uncharacterized protein YjiS (DUF1127 family)
MAFLTIAREAVSHAPSIGVVSRLWTSIMGAREAQAQYRVRSHLRDLPDDVLKDIGVQPHDRDSVDTPHRDRHPGYAQLRPSQGGNRRARPCLSLRDC